MFNSYDENITGGYTQTMYQEFVETLAAGASKTIDCDFKNMRVLEISGGSLQIQFGDQSVLSSVVGAGLGFNLPVAVRKLKLKNSHATDAMTVRIGLSMGRIEDNRLSISGAINVQNSETAPLYTQETRGKTPTYAQVSMTPAAAVLVAANASRKAVTIYAGAADLFIGASNAITATVDSHCIPAGGSMTLDHPDVIYGIRAAATTNATYCEENIQ